MGSIDWAPNWVSRTAVSTVPPSPLHPRSLMCVSRSSAGPEPGPGSWAHSPALAEPSLSRAVPSSESAFPSPMRGAGLGGCAERGALTRRGFPFLCNKTRSVIPGQCSSSRALHWCPRLRLIRCPWDAASILKASWLMVTRRPLPSRLNTGY